MKATNARVVPRQRPAEPKLPVRLQDLLSATPSWCCFLCGARDVTGSTFLSRQPVPACEKGTGCRDGRIFHGPTGPAPHMPTVPCEECGTAETQKVRPHTYRRPGVSLDDGSRGH